MIFDKFLRRGFFFFFFFSRNFLNEVEIIATRSFLNSSKLSRRRRLLSWKKLFFEIFFLFDLTRKWKKRDSIISISRTIFFTIFRLMIFIWRRIISRRIYSCKIWIKNKTRTKFWMISHYWFSRFFKYAINWIIVWFSRCFNVKKRSFILLTRCLIELIVFFK